MVAAQAFGSSHREAPFVTRNPKVDATDFYMFRSYDPARPGFVTLIANYLPLQDAYGGPNYFTLDPEALYEIHVDNTADGGNADSVEDITFQFRFQNPLTDIKLPIALPDGGSSAMVGIPLRIAGQIQGADGGTSPGLINNPETYTLNIVRGGRRTGTPQAVTNVNGGGSTFTKPLDFIGPKTFGGTGGANYETYARSFIYDVTIPGCTTGASTQGRVFVGQRAESFAVNLGVVFDLINAPLAVITTGSRSLFPNPIGNKNITTLALEVPISCLVGTGTNAGIIGGWTTASVRQARVINPNARYDQPSREGGAWAQVSRLSNPLVNELVIGIGDKDKFNSSEPKNDGANFATYVTNPTLPALIEILYGSANAPAPIAIPRTDLVAAFLTGVTAMQGNVNVNGSVSEMIRLNTGVAATASNLQSDFGAASCITPNTAANPVIDLNQNGCDPAGFPNGRRPGDDVTDIALRVVMGRLLNTNVAGAGAAPLHDAVLQTSSQFDAFFPYLKTPNAPY